MNERARILVVDDEEAILETMTFTFEGDYEVLTASSSARALELLDARGPVAVVISDQRMPEMTGVQFLAEVFKRHPETVRIILTGFADMDAIINAINDGHVYAYITKPWEPEQLRQVVRSAALHYELTRENERLLAGLRDANHYLEAVMDQFDTGALAVDAEGLVRAFNRPARQYLGIGEDAKGRKLEEVLPPGVLECVGGAALELGLEHDCSSREVSLPGGGVHLRLSLHALRTGGGDEIGKVILTKEISHEPLRRRFEEIVEALAQEDGEDLRERLRSAHDRLGDLAGEIGNAGVESPGMGELGERTSRTRTAIDHWLAVDASLSREEFPDAQLLMDRVRIAGERWPLGDRIPERVRALARHVEAYYESGEKPKHPVL